ncbi:MAG: DUF3472 domain-containing protein [Bacteroidota bacterium]
MKFIRSIIYKTGIFVFSLIGTTILASGACSSDSQNTKNEPEAFSPNAILIPTAGNTWIANNTFKTTDVITDEGIKNWTNTGDTLRTFFHTKNSGKITIGIRTKTDAEQTRIKLACNGIEKEVAIKNSDYQKIPAGEFNISESGYHSVDIYAASTEQGSLPDISDIIIEGNIESDKISFARDDFYWGRRGPSVHLNYEVPENAGNIKYFYNEITVPEGEDAIGSYFMANGFGQGYFGIQVNSEEERRILFSVWSPYETDDPDEIPEDMRIELLRKGDGVTTGEFGNEGSGGQSYKEFMWKTGTTYGFLLKGEPTGDGATTFTAWFFDPKADQWSLIASFRRPDTDSWLTNLHSFLENFYPETGIISRKVYYSNQWIADTQLNWKELTRAKFSADATARKGARLDYAGGKEESQFFLKNCGFFDERTTIDSNFSREANNKQPEINLSELP